MNEKLKPCPFCGGEAYSCLDYGEDVYRVRCSVCAASTGNWDSKDMAVQFWNSRAEEKADAVKAWNRRANDGMDKKR